MDLPISNWGGRRTTSAVKDDSESKEILPFWSRPQRLFEMHFSVRLLRGKAQTAKFVVDNLLKEPAKHNKKFFLNWSRLPIFLCDVRRTRLRTGTGWGDPICQVEISIGEMITRAEKLKTFFWLWRFLEIFHINNRQESLKSIAIISLTLILCSKEVAGLDLEL